MREKEYLIGAQIEDIPHLTWPDLPIPSHTMEQIVFASQENPLREILADYIQVEGAHLWSLVRPHNYDPTSRSVQDLAINEGYLRTSRFIHVASKYQHAELSSVQQTIQQITIGTIDSGSATTLEEANNNLRNNLTSKDTQFLSGLRTHFTREMDEALDSLTIDPTGIDWLKRMLHIQTNVWNVPSTKEYYGLQNDPGVIGLQAGTSRYQQLYKQALFYGATPDKSAGIVKRNTTRVARKLKNITRF